MSRIALLGGSFNPPHVAHQMAVLWLLGSGRADRIWLVPCFHHPLGKALAPFEDRFRMCELALLPFATGRLEVSRVEQELGGDSRTLFTIQRLIEQHPDLRFSLVIGADILAEKESWYQFDEIERMVDLIVVGRGGYPAPPICAASSRSAPQGREERKSIVLPDVSSTEIRRRIRAGQPVDHLVPEAVRVYIEELGLYRGS